MIVYLNGQFVPETEATVSVQDRSFLYGDGVFSTIRVCNGKPFRWAQHLERMKGGAEFLQIPVKLDNDELLQQALKLVQLNQLSEALLRITVSRGIGVRGYSSADANKPTRVMTLHPVAAVDSETPDRWRLITSTMRVRKGDPLSQWKTANKLVNVMARMEAEQAGANEAILLNEQNEVCECASGNLFWVENGRILTPPLSAGILPGVTRATVMELIARSGDPVIKENCSLERLQRAQATFVTLSSKGVVAVSSQDGRPILESPTVTDLHRQYQLLQNEETQ